LRTEGPALNWNKASESEEPAADAAPEEEAPAEEGGDEEPPAERLLSSWNGEPYSHQELENLRRMQEELPADAIDPLRNGNYN